MSQSSSFWMKNFPKVSHPPLKKDVATEICIIGAGITGLTCAYLLSKKGKKVVVIDADPLEGMQTARTTGHLVNILDSRYFELERLFGKNGSKMVAESHTAAIKLIESISMNEGIDCGFEKVDVYLFTPPHTSKEILQKELEATKEAGLTVKMIPRAPLDYDTKECLHIEHQAQFEPMLYIAGLMKAIEKQGGKFFFKTRAVDVKETHVTTEAGHQIRADATIVATNSPINDRVMIHTKQAPYRTYVIAGKIAPGSIHRAIYYDTSEPYHYVRLATDQETGGEYLIVGGEDHRTGENSHPEQCWAHLEKWTRDRFPTFKKVEYQWSGQVLETIDSLAFLGKNPFDKNIYIATGDSGNGLTHGTLGAILITDLILKRDNEWKDLYDPSRKSLKAFKSYAEENVNTFAQYLDWIKSAPKEKKIAPGTGAILQDGMKKLAVYCDENDQLHTFSAICPHLGGVVRWNSAEKTWDCPCHGSRFNAMGVAICGPTKSDLTNLS